jgi:hypothetical protein
MTNTEIKKSMTSANYGTVADGGRVCLMTLFTGVVVTKGRVVSKPGTCTEIDEYQPQD